MVSEAIDAILDRMEIAPLTRGVAREFVRLFLEGLAAKVRKTGRVAIPHFGVFVWAKTKPRNITNPTTGEPMRLGVTHRLAFRASRNQKTQSK